MNLNWDLPYSSRRQPILAKNIVATSQPLAVQAGLEMLQQGGSAMDAALAAAITLTVVEPTMNGIGGDAFALVWQDGVLQGLNASGRSPQNWTAEYFQKYAKMPERGWDSVTTPGAVSAWVECSQRFGKLEFSKLFDRAIKYANSGFLVTPITAAAWAKTPEELIKQDEFKKTFFSNGQSPLAGENFQNKAQAETLRLIAKSKGEEFYRGSIAKKISKISKDQNRGISMDDLASHSAEWVTPINFSFRGYTLHQLPPNGQGIATLIILGILDNLNIDQFDPDSAEWIHLQIEATKLAFSDLKKYFGDPDAMSLDVKEFLKPEYLSSRAKLIDSSKAQLPSYGIPKDGGTVYVTAADQNGMMVSFIQSNFMGFGSGIVIPDTGISMHNRGCGFTLEKSHVNQVGPRKRPFHTIIPGFVSKDGKPFLSYGVMGGSMQPQGHAQLLSRILCFDQNPQAASDATRWRLVQGLEVEIENGMNSLVIEKLKKWGHQIRICDSTRFGGAQVIMNLNNGYLGASDHRKDGLAAGF